MFFCTLDTDSQPDDMVTDDENDFEAQITAGKKAKTTSSQTGKFPARNLDACEPVTMVRDSDPDEEVAANQTLSQPDDDDDEDVPTPTQYTSKMMAPSQSRFVPSKRLGSRPWLQDEDGYTYRRKGEKNNSIYYVCTQMTERELVCRSRAVFNTSQGGFIQRIQPPHNHSPERLQLRADLTVRVTVDTMVAGADFNPVRPNAVLSKVLHDIEKSDDPEAHSYVPKKECLRSKVRRATLKKKDVFPTKLPSNWKEMREIGFPRGLTVLANGGQFLRFFGPVQEGSEEMMAVFASDRSLELLKTAKIVAADGTFATMPKPFLQLFVLQVKMIFDYI